MRVLFAILFFAAPVAAQDPGVIAGVVRSSATHSPLEDAQVSLIGATSTGTQTDARGNFRFPDLPAGKYTLRIEKPGYGGTESVHVEPGAQPVAVELDPLAQIEGRILDDDGNPALGVTAELTFPYYPKTFMGTSPPSDKGGRFVLSNLSAGDYWIRLRIPEALRAHGYPATEFYPGVADSAQAAAIHLAAAQQMAGLTIRLRRVPLVSFRGRIVDLGNNQAARPVEVALDCEPSEIAGFFGRHEVDAAGHFHFDNVPPGRHEILIYRGTGADDLPYATTVDVGEDEATVTVPPFTTLAGAVKSTDKAPWEGVIGIGLHREGAWRRRVTPGDDGAFTLPDIPPGEWTLDVESNGLEAAGHALQVASVKFGEASVIRQPIAVVEGGNPPIAITLSGETGGIAGTVEPGDPADPALVVAQSLDGHPLNLLTTVTTGQDGSFAFAGLLPGDYQVCACGRAFVRKTGYGGDCTGLARKVAVTNGQTATLKLHRCDQ
ncbi:MAG: carboxypeptidase regulatory-like domain-containing protein [Candidatus Sulfopaludibacter sp.]|nr:carboxypeptidase regulatory-like domain-containing protein [Candidatus Sulfopaludibacter sp.]